MRESFETALDAYRDRVGHSLWRFFNEYAPGKWLWLTVGSATTVLAYGTLLVTPVGDGWRAVI